MMGRQINFFMSETDELEFIDYVVQDKDVCIIYGSYYSEPSPRKLNTTEDFQKAKSLSWEGMCFFCRSPYNLKMEHVSARNVYCIDRLKSNVIEFSRCRLDEQGRLREGRIYTIARYWENNILIEKEEAFLKWFSRLQRWIRRRYFRSNSFYYVGPGACEWYRQGRTLQSVSVVVHPILPDTEAKSGAILESSI